MIYLLICLCNSFFRKRGVAEVQAHIEGRLQEEGIKVKDSVEQGHTFSLKEGRHLFTGLSQNMDQQGLLSEYLLITVVIYRQDKKFDLVWGEANLPFLSTAKYN